MSSLVATVGMLVSSENVTVMVSPSVNPDASPSIAPSGSSATNEVMVGPALTPNVPVNGGDSDVDADDPSAVCSSAVDFTSNLN